MVVSFSAGRFTVRDFVDHDRNPFVRYQTDPRYRELYDLPEDHFAQASEIFSSFLQWQLEISRRNFQLAIIDPADGALPNFPTVALPVRRNRRNSAVRILSREIVVLNRCVSSRGYLDKSR
jgi:hypothetical protein